MTALLPVALSIVIMPNARSESGPSHKSAGHRVG